MAKPIINIFQYTNLQKYLKDKFQEKKEGNHGFSHRVFARTAGLKSTNFLNLLIKGERKLSREGIEKFARGFGLEKKEAAYFEVLVLFNQAENPGEKRKYYDRMLSFRDEVKAKTLEKRQYQYFSRWYIPAIRELVALPGFEPRAKWISEKLSPEITVKEASEALKILEELGLIKKDANNKWRQTDQVLTTGPEVQSLFAAAFHEAMMQVAKESINRFPAENREISSLTVTISREGFKIIRDKIRKFQDELLKVVTADQKSDEVYQVNFQLFPLIEVNRLKG